MADQTLAAIFARFRTVLEASPLSLKATKDAFSHDRQPNSLLHGSYYLADGGLVSSRPVGNYKAVRIDRVVIYIAASLKFAGETAKETMETTLLTAERYIKADGHAQSYHAEIASGRRISRPKGGDFLIASLPITVDYDVNESTI